MDATIKFILGYIRFLFVYMLLGVFANAIIYICAGVISYIVDPSFADVVARVFSSPGSINEQDAYALVKAYYSTIKASIPGDAFLDESLGVAFNGLALEGVDGNIFTMLYGIVNGAESGALMVPIGDYTVEFVRDIAKVSLSSLLIFILLEIKGFILKKASLADGIAFALASVFWIFASYTFGECVIFCLERIINNPGMNILLYVILIITSCGISIVSNAYSGKLKLFFVFLSAVVKIVFSIIKALLSWLLARNLDFSAGIWENIMDIIGLAAILIAMTAFEMWLSKKQQPIDGKAK